MYALPHTLANFKQATRGSVTLIAAMAALPMMLGIGVAVDFVNRNKFVSDSQAAADAAALAGAMTKKSLTPLNQVLTGDAAKQDAALKMIEANLPDGIKNTSHTSNVTIDGNKVKVDLTVTMKTAFMRVIGVNTVNIKVTSTAVRYDGRACLIALGANGSGVNLSGNADILAPGCWAYSNKTGSNSVYVGGTSTLTTAGTCMAGTANLANLLSATPAPKKCAPLSDPMAVWTPPSTSSSCDYNNFKKSANAANKDITLKPGIYCGGLKANGFDNVTLQSGIYFVKDGTLDITSKL